MTESDQYGNKDDEGYVELTIDVTVHELLHTFFRSAGGLAAAVFTVLAIPGDVKVRPAADDWEAPANEPGDLYTAACLQTHPLVFENVTPEGYWVGSQHEYYQDAKAEADAHEHPTDAFVLLYRPDEQLLEPVTPV